MQLLDSLYQSLLKHSANNAFVINGHKHSYHDLCNAIELHRRALKNIEEEVIAVVANDDLDTYASLIALWFEGKAYLPLNPSFPAAYNTDIAKKAKLSYYFDSKENAMQDLELIKLSSEVNSQLSLSPINSQPDQILYLLFTSGSTGEPKGVPINISNLTAFLEASNASPVRLNEKDKCLQMFELTFDLSIVSFLLPLLSGACVYTIPKNEIKYLYIVKLMQAEGLSHLVLVPTIVTYLNALLSPKDCSSIRSTIFCGEPLEVDSMTQWSKLLNNALIVNAYGPTEATIYCTLYSYNSSEDPQNLNGIISIGRAMKDNELIIVNDQMQIASNGETGELCLHGPQVMNGYLGTLAKDPFIEIDGKRYYRTGDLVVQYDEELYFLGRLDSQVKIQGFRVELLEIEYRVKKFIDRELTIYAYDTPYSGTSAALAIEGEAFDTSELEEKLKINLPAHMIPSKIGFMQTFPQNANGKTDRKAIKQLLESNIK